MMILTLLLALQDCDAMHGVGCINNRGACGACKAATDFRAVRCDACASKEGVCSMCGERKRVHGLIAEIDKEFQSAFDLFADQVANLPMNFRGRAAPRENGNFGYRVAKLPKNSAVYARVCRIDLAGGEPGAFECDVADRPVRIVSTVEIDPKRSLETKIEVIEPACKACGTPEALVHGAVPAIETDHGFRAKGKALLFRSGTWKLDGVEVKVLE